MNINLLIKNSDKVLPTSPETYKLKKAYFSILKYLHENDWSGACHATSSILYVLLKEQGLNVEAYIGEVTKDNIVFDHSWVEINGKVYDAAISNTLIQGVNFSPVFNGYDLETNEETKLNYSFCSGEGLEDEMAFYSGNTLGFYMDGFPNHPKGLWGIASIIAKEIGVKFNIGKAKQKYSNDRWQQKANK